MTENTTTVAPESVARPTEKAKREVYSKDYVDIVLGQIRKRKLSMFALLVLNLLSAVAIYAPLIANDRPIYFHGVDLASYRKAQRELPLAAGAMPSFMNRSIASRSVTKSRIGSQLVTRMLMSILLDPSVWSAATAYRAAPAIGCLTLRRIPRAC